MIAKFFVCFSESSNFTILHSSICILAHFFALSDFYLAVHSLSVSRAQRRALDCLLTPTNWKQILPIVSMKYIGKWKLKKNDFVRFGVQTLKVKANWKSTSARWNCIMFFVKNAGFQRINLARCEQVKQFRRQK